MIIKDTDVFKGQRYDKSNKLVPSAMTLEDIAQSGVTEANQPYILPETGRAIQNDPVGYILINKRTGKTYLPSEVNWFRAHLTHLIIYPVVVRLNTGNFGYHYEVDYEHGTDYLKGHQL